MADRKILQFALAHTFTPGDFTITNKGGRRLNPQMAKVVASQVAEPSTDPIVSEFIRDVRRRVHKSGPGSYIARQDRQ